MALVCPGAAIHAQNNRIDTVAPSAPELAAHGPLAIGVRTIQVTDTNRPDIVNTKEGAPTARYDRTLTLEVWYPAMLAAGQKSGGEYKVITRDPSTTATLYGQAVRDAPPRLRQGRRPGARGRRRPFWRVSARHHFARLSRQPLPDESHRREPREQGVRRGVDRSQGQHLRRSEGVCQHALQPPVRSTVRAECDRAAESIGIREFPDGNGGCQPHRHHRLLDGRLRRGERDRRRLQCGERDVSECAAEQVACRTRRRELRDTRNRAIRASRPRSRSVRGVCRAVSGMRKASPAFAHP